MKRIGHRSKVALFVSFENTGPQNGRTPKEDYAEASKFGYEKI